VLRHDPLNVMLARQPEHPFAILLNVVAIQQSLPPVGNNRAKPVLTVYQGHVTLVFAFAPRQIEGIEPWFATPEQEVFELGFAMAVESDDFAVEHD
jgi:hypothetical protein